MKANHWRRMLPAIGLAAVVGLNGCSRDQQVTAPPGVSLNETDGGLPHNVSLCKVGPVGTWADFTIEADGGVLPNGGALRLDAAPSNTPSCISVWYASTPKQDPDPTVSVTITEVGSSAGLLLDRITVFGTLDGPFNIEDPASGAVTVHVNFDVGGTVIFKNTEIPFEEECNGLTPGYWKNWRNHYTAAQFTSLLAGTIAGSIAEADAIFAAKPSSSRVARLKWFVLANQLTLNLTGTDLPNPDDATLGPTCNALGGGATLGGTLATALDMIANPGNYTDEEIEAIKDILDAIANLD